MDSFSSDHPIIGKIVKIETENGVYDACVTDATSNMDYYFLCLDNGRFYIKLSWEEGNAFIDGEDIGPQKSYDYKELEQYMDADGEYDLTKLPVEKAKEIISKINYFPLSWIRPVKLVEGWQPL